MQFSEVFQIMPEEKIIELAIANNTTPEEIVRKALTMRTAAAQWSRAHREYGRLQDVSTSQVGNDATCITATWEMNKVVRGSNVKDCRSRLYSPHEKEKDEMFNKLNSLIDQQCVFYVGYVENKEDGSVFRVLLDVEAAN